MNEPGCNNSAEPTEILTKTRPCADVWSTLTDLVARASLLHGHQIHTNPIIHKGMNISSREIALLSCTLTFCIRFRADPQLHPSPRSAARYRWFWEPNPIMQPSRHQPPPATTHCVVPDMTKVGYSAMADWLTDTQTQTHRHRHTDPDTDRELSADTKSDRFTYRQTQW